jgi:hypothetical protein
MIVMLFPLPRDARAVPSRRRGVFSSVYGNTHNVYTVTERIFSRVVAAGSTAAVRPAAVHAEVGAGDPGGGIGRHRK